MISFNRYVRITSGVGGGAGVRQRDLIGRIFTESPIVSPDAVMEFSGDIAKNVGAVFGTNSEEYRRAVQYAGYVSPSTSSPKKLSFARLASAGSVAAVYGNTELKNLVAIQSIQSGVLSLTAAGSTVEFTAISFADAVSLSAVAATLQVKLNAGAAPFNAATVTYDAPTARFIIRYGASVMGQVSVNSAGAGSSDVGKLLGLYAQDGASFVSGAPGQSLLEAIQRADNITDNYGSLLFIKSLTLGERAEVAAYVKSLNVKCMYCVPTVAAEAVAVSAALLSFGGTALTLIAGAGDYAEMIPMTILAATDYSKRNGVQGYMYKQMPGVTASVTDDPDADLYDSLRVNYYGRTQTSGQRIDFYQRGTLMGGATDPVDMNTYANEMWLKDYAASQCMSLQLSMGRIPANKSGLASIRGILQPVIDAAVFNGVISVGKTLTPVQRVYIETVTGDPLAWNAVQNIGYVLSLSIQPYTTTNGATEYKAVYVLVYSKDDTIRLIEGTHTLV